MQQVGKWGIEDEIDFTSWVDEHPMIDALSAITNIVISLI